MKQALQLYNEPSLPGWLKQLDASKLTLEDCREVHRFTRARDYDPDVLKRRLGASCPPLRFQSMRNARALTGRVMLTRSELESCFIRALVASGPR